MCRTLSRQSLPVLPDACLPWHARAVDPRPTSPMLLAPGSSSHAVAAPSYAPGPRQPAIDENVLTENAGYEIVDGQVFQLAPAEEDHGTEHFDLPGLLKHCLTPAYKGTVDMLSRPSIGRNHAPDVSILPRARDPETRGRQVEDLIFEVIDTESLAHVTDKTRKLIARGVRRAFLIDVNDRTVCEWSREVDDWAQVVRTAASGARWHRRRLPSVFRPRGPRLARVKWCPARPSPSPRSSAREKSPSKSSFAPVAVEPRGGSDLR